MAKKKVRSLKVYGQSDYNYKTTPYIRLKGDWLREIGFEAGRYIQVKYEEGKLIITLDVAREKMLEKEKEYIEIEQKRMYKEIRKERALYSAQLVAEPESGYESNGREVLNYES